MYLPAAVETATLRHCSVDGLRSVIDRTAVVWKITDRNCLD